MKIVLVLGTYSDTADSQLNRGHLTLQSFWSVKLHSLYGVAYSVTEV